MLDNKNLADSIINLKSQLKGLNQQIGSNCESTIEDLDENLEAENLVKLVESSYLKLHK